GGGKAGGRWHRGGRGGHREGDAARRQPVGALTADLDRRRGRDRQLDLTAEARERLLELALRGRLVLLGRLSFRIGGRRPRGEVDVGYVAFVQADEARTKLSCRS